MNKRRMKYRLTKNKSFEEKSENLETLTITQIFVVRSTLVKLYRMNYSPPQLFRN